MKFVIIENADKDGNLQHGSYVGNIAVFASEVPGLMVHKTGHVGVYIGNGVVVEARGFASGVVTSALYETAWTHWLAVPWISYAGYEDLLMGKPESFPFEAQVTTSRTPLNIWRSTSKDFSELQVAKGDTVTVLGIASIIGWYQVEKDGFRGVSDARYLTRIASDSKAEEGGTEAETGEDGGGGFYVVVSGFHKEPLTDGQALSLANELGRDGYDVDMEFRD